jgi:hypothetical protein
MLALPIGRTLETVKVAREGDSKTYFRIARLAKKSENFLAQSLSRYQQLSPESATVQRGRRFRTLSLRQAVWHYVGLVRSSEESSGDRNRSDEGAADCALALRLAPHEPVARSPAKTPGRP